MKIKYGRIIDGVLRLAPGAIRTDRGLVVNPGAATYLKLGWKRISDPRPAVGENQHLVLAGYTESDTVITVNYKVEDNIDE